MLEKKSIIINKPEEKNKCKCPQNLIKIFYLAFLIGEKYKL